MQQQDNQTILVTGAQRSGTSLTAGILFYLGVYMGDWFLKRNINNPLGFFEDLEFVNTDIARRQGKCPEEEWERIVTSIAERRSKYPYWGLKSCEGCWFVDDYKRVLNPKIIWVYRENKKAHYKSLKKLYPEEDWKGMRDDKHAFLNEKREKSWLVISLEQIIENPDWAIGVLEGFTGVHTTDEKRMKARSIILQEPRKGVFPMESSSLYL